MAKLEIDDVTMRFGDVVAVDRVSLEVSEGETVVLLGPSGCGKTTLLRLIAGFNRPTAGAIRIAGRTVTSPTVMRSAGLGEASTGNGATAPDTNAGTMTARPSLRELSTIASRISSATTSGGTTSDPVMLRLMNTRRWLLEAAIVKLGASTTSGSPHSVRPCPGTSVVCAIRSSPKLPVTSSLPATQKPSRRNRPSPPDALTVSSFSGAPGQAPRSGVAGNVRTTS